MNGEQQQPSAADRREGLEHRIDQEVAEYLPNVPEEHREWAEAALSDGIRRGIELENRRLRNKGKLLPPPPPSPPPRGGVVMIFQGFPTREIAKGFISDVKSHFDMDGIVESCLMEDGAFRHTATIERRPGDDEAGAIALAKEFGGGFVIAITR